jgi:uncharacterized protein (DUF58 family)
MLEWKVMRPLARQLGGDSRSLLSGAGVELHGLREYQPGEDVRRIDWNITARVGQPFLRESLVERALDAWLVVDVSASTDWGTALCLKRDRIIEFVAAASQLLGRHGNRVGALLFAERPLQIVPPSRGRSHLLGLIDSVDAVPVAKLSGRTDLAGALAYMGGQLGRRSLIFIVSDFMAAPGWEQVVRRLSHHHEIVAVDLYDPREGFIPDVGLVTFEDPETGRQLVVDTADARLRERFQWAAMEQREYLCKTLAGCGIDLLELTTAEEMLPALVRFLKMRQHQTAMRSQELGRSQSAQRAASR